MTTETAKPTTGTIGELNTGLSDISELTTEVVACCQLSSFAAEATLDRLRTRLLAEQPNLRVYTALGGSLDPLASPLDASSFSKTLNNVHANTLQLAATLRRIRDHISPLPTLYDPSSDISITEKTNGVFTVLEKETELLSQYFLSLSRAFHDFWKERLTLHTEPPIANIANIPPSVVVARAAQKLDSLVDHIITVSFEKYRSGSYASSGDAWAQIIPTLDSATDSVVSEVLAWVASREAASIAQEMFQLICEHLWCSRFITVDADLARVRAELEVDGIPVTTAARVLPALLQTRIVRSRMCSHLVVPIGSTGSGKDSLIDALIGKTVLPPNGLPTASPCRIRHQRGLTEPTLTVPRPALQAALNCLRRTQPSKRRAEFAALERRRSSVDSATRDRLMKFEFLEDKFVMMLESPDYDIPETVRGVVSVRRILNDLNTLGRTCRSLCIPFNLACVEWPTISVDFQSLHDSPDSWEFWSVPGEYSADALPDDVEYFNRPIEYHANVVPMINYQQRMVDLEWVDLPSRLRSAQAIMPCVLGTAAEDITPDDLQEFQAELGREVFNDSSSSRVLICDLLWGPPAAALLRLLQSPGGKPSYTVFSSDPQSFESLFLSHLNIKESNPGKYDATPLRALVVESTRYLEKSQLAKTLQNLVEWIPQSTRQSLIESMRLMVTRCSELEKEIDAIIGSGLLVALREKEQEEKIGALLDHIRIITETNLVDIQGILQVFHDRFAKHVAEELHSSILSCVETIPPTPGQTTAEQLEFLFSGMELAQLTGRIGERLQGAFDRVISQELAQGLEDALGPLFARELSVLPTDLAAALGILVTPFHERFRLDSKTLPNIPPIPTLDEIKQHCDLVHPTGSVKALFEDCRHKLPLIGKRRRHRILSPLTALLAIFPFLLRWPELLHDTPPSYRVNILRLEQFYRDNLTTPWQNDLLKMVDSTIENGVKEVARAVEETRLKLNVEMKLDNLRLLLAAKGSLHFSVAVLPYLFGGGGAR